MSGNTYLIPTFSEAPDWGQVSPILIDTYPWNCGYRPKTEARICFVKDVGFALRILCGEQNPRATFTNINELVCQDSCLECFLNFKPELPDIGYLNVEVNANGAMWCQYGVDRHHRTFLVDAGMEHPRLTMIREEKRWGYELMIPLKLVKQIYGNAEFSSGSVIRGNFYKCGDCTESPHYGSWTMIDNPEPDFHRPEAFGHLVIA